MTKIIGTTKDGRLLLGGLFYYYDTLGLHPLDAYIRLREHYSISLPDFFADALQAGWSPDRAEALLREFIATLEGPRKADEKVPALIAHGKQLFMERVAQK